MKNKKQNKKEIIITKDWLQRLIDIAKELDRLMEEDKNNGSFNNAMRIHIKYTQLIGYISSAKDILREKGGEL